jgi:predicted RNase H-like nuclease (RuvC/YqgF family)
MIQQKPKGDVIYTVVGVDPGTTAALAILSLDGTPVFVHSGKNFSLEDIISLISRFGSPCIIATDVNPAPHAVDKVSHSFDCKLFVPPSDLQVEEKNILTKNYTFNNFHQRDALAAALKALEHYRAKFDNVDARLQERGLQKYSESVKHLVLKGYSVEKAIELLQEPKKPAPVGEVSQEVEPESREPLSVPDLQKKIQELTQTAERLTAYKNELEQNIEKLETTLDNTRHQLRLYDKETRREVIESNMIKSRESVIKKLRKELEIEREKNNVLFQENEILKEMQILEYSQKALPVKVLTHFSKEEIKALDERVTIKSDDIIYLKDASGGGTSTARELIRKGVRAVITHERMSHLAEEEFTRVRIPVFSEGDVNLKALGNFGVIDKDMFESAYQRWKTATDIREARVLEQQLQSIVEEYKEKRIKDEQSH